ncbi:MAG: hypothetical protein A4S16_01830 [Proteobacteria bacterium SG_bin6]|nr:MAG: hypothetical protein A4S16_01830 [Proteobacteria bacterium SG_bin6]
MIGWCARFAATVIFATILALPAGTYAAGEPRLPPFDEARLQAQLNADPAGARAQATPYSTGRADVPLQSKAAALRVIAISYAVQGDNDRARRAFEGAYGVSAAQGDLVHMAGSQINIGTTWLQSHDYARAIDAYRRGAKLAARARHYVFHGNALSNLSQAMAELGDPESALKLNREAEQLYARADKPVPPASYVQRAGFQLQLGKPAAAIAELDRARSLLPDDDAIYGSELEADRAEALTALSRFEEARRALRSCMALANAANLDPARVRCLNASARLAIATGQPAAARGYIARMMAVRAGSAEGKVADLTFERDVAKLRHDLARIENRPADTAREAAGLVELDRQILNNRQKVALAVGALEMERQGKDLSIDLLEARNANLLLRDQQQRLLTIAAFVALAAIALGALWWTRTRQARLRREQRLEERARIARDLHDTLLQDMAGTQLALGAAAYQAEREGSALAGTLEDITSQVSRAMVSARNAVWRMRNDAIDRGDLIGAVLAWLDQAHAAQRNIIHVEAPRAPSRIDAAKAEHLLRIIQEGVNNALRHGNPGRIDVTIAAHGNRLDVSIVDDGSGFVPEAAGTNPGSHWGLVGVRERVDGLGGMLRVNSVPGHGTQLILTVPI